MKKIRKRWWKEYFRVLINKKFLEKNQDEVEWKERQVDKINEHEVLSIISKIKWRNAMGFDRLPAEVWKVLEKMESSVVRLFK